MRISGSQYEGTFSIPHPFFQEALNVLIQGFALFKQTSKLIRLKEKNCPKQNIKITIYLLLLISTKIKNLFIVTFFVKGECNLSQVISNCNFPSLWVLLILYIMSKTLSFLVKQCCPVQLVHTIKDFKSYDNNQLKIN